MFPVSSPRYFTEEKQFARGRGGIKLSEGECFSTAAGLTQIDLEPSQTLCSLLLLVVFVSTITDPSLQNMIGPNKYEGKESETPPSPR